MVPLLVLLRPCPCQCFSLCLLEQRSRQCTQQFCCSYWPEVQRLSDSASRMLEYNLETLCLGKGSLLKVQKGLPMCKNASSREHRWRSSLFIFVTASWCGFAPSPPVLRTDLKARLIFFLLLGFICCCRCCCCCVSLFCFVLFLR